MPDPVGVDIAVATGGGGGLARGSLAGFGSALGGLASLIGLSKKAPTPAQPAKGFLSPSQKPFLEDLFQRAEDVTQDSTFTGFNPLQQAGQFNALNTAGGLGPLIGGAQSANQFLLGDVLNPASNPFLQASARAATQPIFEGLTQNILPSIRNQAAGTGNVGSSRQGIAEGLAIQGAQRQAGDISTNLFSQAYGQGLGALLSGLQQAPQTAQFGFLPSQIQQQIGGQQRGLEQERLLDPFTQTQRFQELLGPPLVVSSLTPGGLGGPTGEGIPTPGQVQGQFGGGLAGELVQRFFNQQRQRAEQEQQQQDELDLQSPILGRKPAVRPGLV